MMSSSLLVLHQKPTVEQLCLFLKPVEIRMLCLLAKPLFNCFRQEMALKTAFDALSIKYCWDHHSVIYRLDIIIFLHENDCPGCTSRVMDRAALNGCCETVVWLHENRNEGCTDWAMDWAADNGYMNILKWLNENRNEGCTKFALFWAAQSGHLLIVRWLCENRKEFASDLHYYIDVMKEAIKYATYNGHIQIGEWLEERLLTNNNTV